MKPLDALCLSLCCLVAAGCELGSGGPTGRQRDPLDSMDPCTNVDPARCDLTAGCQLVTTCPPCPPGVVCPQVCQVECRSSGTTPPPPPSRCAGLDELTCRATPTCQPLYGGVCPACVPGTGCPPCTSGYLGCTDAQPPPPPPPPSRCAGLDELTCRATPTCQPLYGGVCPACVPGTVCPPCTSGYLGCTDAQQPPPPPPPSRCAGLDETTCRALPLCQPLYGGVCQTCRPGATCPPCTTQYLGCTDAPQPPPNRCAGLDERGCNQASGCQGVYGTCPPNGPCACPVGTNCTIEPVLFISCQPDVGVCAVEVGGGGSSPPEQR